MRSEPRSRTGKGPGGQLPQVGFEGDERHLDGFQVKEREEETLRGGRKIYVPERGFFSKEVYAYKLNIFEQFDLLCGCNMHL